MSSLLGSVKTMKNPFTSQEDQDETNDADNDTFFTQVKKTLPVLTYKERVLGFGICIGLAALFSVLGCGLAYVSLAMFAVLFTLGTIAGICSTIFLVGPIDQVKSIYKSSSMGTLLTKIICIVVILVMIVLVFCSAFWWDQGFLAILFCSIEFVALIIYSVTLIPFATTLITRGARSALSL